MRACTWRCTNFDEDPHVDLDANGNVIGKDNGNGNDNDNGNGNCNGNCSVP